MAPCYLNVYSARCVGKLEENQNEQEEDDSESYGGERVEFKRQSDDLDQIQQNSVSQAQNNQVANGTSQSRKGFPVVIANLTNKLSPTRCSLALFPIFQSRKHSYVVTDRVTP